MTEIFQIIAVAWGSTSQLEIISTGFGLAYVILAARENGWCWPAAFIGTATAIVLFWDASLLMESALNVYYLAMAIYGWWQWQYGSSDRSPISISKFKTRQHLLSLALIVSLTLISGYLLSENTTAKLPYIDSFTSWAAVVTTWMIARKILENWLYWIVIDAVSIYLYFERGLYLYALLFVIYILVAIFGYLNWLRHFQQLSVANRSIT